MKVNRCFKPLFSLAPKAYYAFDKGRDTFKRSSKGVQHRVRLSYEDYKETLYQSTVKEVTNVCIRMVHGKMATIQCKKNGLSNKLIKSYVQDDKVTVQPFLKFQ